MRCPTLRIIIGESIGNFGLLLLHCNYTEVFRRLGHLVTPLITHTFVRCAILNIRIFIGRIIGKLGVPLMRCNYPELFRRLGHFDTPAVPSHHVPATRHLRSCAAVGAAAEPGYQQHHFTAAVALRINFGVTDGYEAHDFCCRGFLSMLEKSTDKLRIVPGRLPWLQCTGLWV